MWEKLLNAWRTFRPHLSQVDRNHESLHESMLATLGRGDTREAVKCPYDVEFGDWLVINLIDFFNELSLLWGIIVQDPCFHVTFGVGEGFPRGFEYRWKDKHGFSIPVRCSGPEYVEHVLHWAESALKAKKISDESYIYSAKFQVKAMKIMKKYFRCYAIIYSSYSKELESKHALGHFNASFKHFLYYVWEFNLVPAEELEALFELVDALRDQYYAK